MPSWVQGLSSARFSFWDSFSPCNKTPRPLHRHRDRCLPYRHGVGFLPQGRGTFSNVFILRLIFFSGNRREGFVAADERNDDEVHGPKVGSGAQNMQLDQQDKGTKIYGYLMMNKSLWGKKSRFLGVEIGKFTSL